MKQSDTKVVNSNEFLQILYNNFVTKYLRSLQTRFHSSSYTKALATGVCALQQCLDG